MKRMIPLVFTALAVGVLHAAPARLPYVPEKLPAPPQELDLRGTTWDSRLKAEDRMFVFHSDGTLHFGGNTEKSSWRVEGNTVYVEINNGYRFFRGTVQGDVMEGESWNIAGSRWTTRLERVRSFPKK